MSVDSSDKALLIVPELGTYLRDEPFSKYHLGNGNLIKILETVETDGYFIRSRHMDVDASKNPSRQSSLVFEPKSRSQSPEAQTEGDNKAHSFPGLTITCFRMQRLFMLSHKVDGEGSTNQKKRNGVVLSIF